MTRANGDIGKRIMGRVYKQLYYLSLFIMKTGLERRINMGDLGNVAKNTRLSTVEWLRTIKNYVKYANQSGIYDDVEKYINGVKKYF